VGIVITKVGQMTKRELLKVLNEDALSLGVLPITVRKLSDWIDDGLLDGANPKGVRRGVNPDWQFSEESVARARLILKSISCGSVRKTEHRIFVWVHAHDYPFELIFRAINSRFSRFLKRQRRKLEWQYDHRNRVDPKRKERFLRQLPQLDNELKNAGFEQPPEALLQMMSEAHWGTDGTASSLKSLVENMATQFGIPSEQIAEMASKISVVGLLGNPDEIDLSGLAILKMAIEGDFVQGRRNFQLFLAQITQLNSLDGFPENEFLDRMRDPIRKAFNSVLRPDWLISTLASTIVAAHKVRKGMSG
jgi:hypothetical protein